MISKINKRVDETLRRQMSDHKTPEPMLCEAFPIEPKSGPAIISRLAVKKRNSVPAKPCVFGNVLVWPSWRKATSQPPSLLSAAGTAEKRLHK